MQRSICHHWPVITLTAASTQSSLLCCCCPFDHGAPRAAAHLGMSGLRQAHFKAYRCTVSAKSDDRNLNSECPNLSKCSSTSSIGHCFGQRALWWQIAFLIWSTICFRYCGGDVNFDDSSSAGDARWDVLSVAWRRRTER